MFNINDYDECFYLSASNQYFLIKHTKTYRSIDVCNNFGSKYNYLTNFLSYDGPSLDISYPYNNFWRLGLRLKGINEKT